MISSTLNSAGIPILSARASSREEGNVHQQHPTGSFAGKERWLADFRDSALESWLGGARILASLSDEMVGFIHPVDNEMLASVNEPEGNKLADVMSVIKSESGL